MIFPISFFSLCIPPFRFRFLGFVICSPFLVVHPRFKIIFFSLSIAQPIFVKPAADETIHFLKSRHFFRTKCEESRHRNVLYISVSKLFMGQEIP